MTSGFRQFVEKTDYFSVVKKNLRVPKRLWFGMPVIVSNVKIGHKKITKPTIFYVKDFDRDSVTINSLSDPGVSDKDCDFDDEIDLSKDDDEIEAIITRDDFQKLMEPQIDPNAAAGGAGGMGGMPPGL